MLDARPGNSLFFITLACLISFFTLQFTFNGAECAVQPQEEYKRIQKDIRIHKQKLESVKKKEISALEELRKTTAELNEIEKQLAAQKDKIKQLYGNILAIQNQIANDSALVQTQRAYLKKRLKTLNMFTSNKDAFLALLSGEDIAQTLRLERYLRDISKYDYRLVRKYSLALHVMARKENGLKKLFADVKTDEENLSVLEGSLQDKKKEREALLAGVRKEKDMFEKMIKDMKDTSRRLLTIIRATERQEQQARKKHGARTSPEAREEEPQYDSGVGRLKGKLLWPVSGEVVLQYGTQMDPIFNLPVFRSGINVKTENGASVRAIHEGRVVFADDFKGYGQLVIVSHGGGYHSLYGNLSKIFSKKGAIISDRQIIGETGESSTLGTSGLYFEIRYKGKPLDPEQWLTK